MDIKERYLHDNLLDIEYLEFNWILDKYNLEFKNEFIRILIKQSDRTEILILYLIHLWRLGSVNDGSNTINEYEYRLPWSKELFTRLLDDDVDVAADYLLNHIDELEDININQELFETLISKCHDNNITIELIHKFQSDININSQVSVHLYETLLTVNEPDILLNKLNQNTVYKIVDKLPLESSSEFLHQFLVYKDMDRDKIFKFLSNLSAPFNSINLKGGQIRFSIHHTNIKELLNYLKSEDLKIISSFTPSEQGYIVNRKRK